MIAYKVWSFPFGEWETVFHYASGISSINVVVTLLGTFSCKRGPSHNWTQTFFAVQKKKKNNTLISMFSKGTVAWKGIVGNRDEERENELSFI